jgi:Domain of unknown function (DUF6430)
MQNQLWQSLAIGVKRRWLDGLRNGFGAVGAAWTLVEVLTKAIKPLDTYIDTHGGDFLNLMVLLFVAVFIACVFEPTHVTFKVPTTDTKITLKYGDLFNEEANLLIGVNELFDGDLGVPVAKNTVHGQFIMRNYGGSAAAFRATVDPALATTGAQPKPTGRAMQPGNAYPIGTTVMVPNGAHSAFLMAMAHTEIATSKASSDVPTLWAALKGGLQSVHDQGNGEPLAMPLFGNGQAGIKLAPQHLLRLLILALVDFATSSNARLPKQITIALHHSCFSELDIQEIAQDWKKI